MNSGLDQLVNEFIVDMFDNEDIIKEFDSDEKFSSQVDKFISTSSCLDKIKDENRIGHGTFSNVYKYSEQYALKVYNPSFYKMLDTTIELFILTQMKHSSILKSHFVAHKKESIMFLLPLYEKTLAKIFPTTMEQKNSIMKQLISGVQYLHSRRILHLDLAPRNILVKQEGENYKIVDERVMYPTV